eukprot:5291925-Amphidinium_carterae.1
MGVETEKEDSEDDLELGCYVVSIVGAGIRRLHRIGECRYLPGRDYLRYQVFGSDLPSPEQYHRVCRLCFRTSMPMDGGVVSDGSTDEDSDATDASQ